MAEIRHRRGYAACDGPSYLRRSVLQVRNQVQRVNFSSEVTQLVTVHRIYDGPCCSSVVKFRELIPVPRFLSLSVLERRSSTDRCAYDGLSYLSSRLCGEQQKKLHKYGTTGPSRSVVTMTVHRVIRRPSQFLSQMISLLETTKQVATL